MFELEAETMRVLANPKRLMILAALGEEPRTVTALADDLAIPLANVSQHLRVMKDRRIVRATRSGKTVRYELTSPTFSRCCALVREALVEQARRSERSLRGFPVSDTLSPRRAAALAP